MNSRTRPWGFAIVLVVALAGAACEKKTASNVVIAETAGDQVTKNIVVHDPRFAKSVKILDLKVRRERDLLEGFIIVQNQTEETVPFEYRVEWYDQDQVQIETPITSWKPVTLDGRMTKTLRELSPRTEAVSFKFYVRAPNAIEP
ncbi:MAG: YcfL family protein [bacterium]